MSNKPSFFQSEYAKKLRDPRWQKMRLDVMQRDGFTCKSCGDKTSTFNVHHTYYDSGKSPWEYPRSSLVTLCEECHKIETETYREYTKTAIKALSSSGMTSDYIFNLSVAFLGYDFFQLSRDERICAFMALEEYIRNGGVWDLYNKYITKKHSSSALCDGGGI